MRHKKEILKAIEIVRNYPHLVFRPGLPPLPQKFQEGTSQAADFVSIIIIYHKIYFLGIFHAIKALLHLLFYFRHQFISLSKKTRPCSNGFLGNIHFW